MDNQHIIIITIQLLYIEKGNWCKLCTYEIVFVVETILTIAGMASVTGLI